MYFHGWAYHFSIASRPSTGPLSVTRTASCVKYAAAAAASFLFSGSACFAITSTSFWRSCGSGVSYGIKFASNFQPEIGKRDVKDTEADLTREHGDGKSVSRHTDAGGSFLSGLSAGPADALQSLKSKVRCWKLPMVGNSDLSPGPSASHDRYLFSRMRSCDFWPGIGHQAIQAPGSLGTPTQNIDPKIPQDTFQSDTRTKLASLNFRPT
jgi:hypothetical protein